MLTDINQKTLKDLIEESKITNKAILIDFYAEWCGPCKMATPILEKISNMEYEGIDFFKVNVDSNMEIAKEYGIKSIPSFVLLKGGEVKNKMIGSPTTERLKEFISEYTQN